jgi:type I restriction enzyme S subunit
MRSRNLSGCQIFHAKDLPHGWDCVPLKERMEFLYGRALHEEDRRPGEVDVFGSNGKVGTHNAEWLKAPGILVGRKGTVGAVHYATRPFWPIDTVYYINPLKGDNFRFLYYLLQYLPLSFLNAATGVPGLSRRDAYALRGAFPPPEEQAAIARILDGIDTAIEQTRDALEKVGVLRRALMQELLPPWIGFRHLEDDQMPSGVETIEIAKDVADVCNGSTPSRTEGRYWRDGTIPWLATGKVHDRVIVKADEYVTPAALRECSISLLPRGTVLVGMIGQGRTRGMSAYLDIEACINQNFGAFVPRENVRNRVFGKWLFYHFDYHYSRLREVGGGTNQGALNCYLLKRIRLPLPKWGRQKEVAAILDSVEELERARSLTLQHYISLKSSLMHDLLTGKVRVNNLILEGIATS